MLADYSDIRSRITEPPKWFDENGVPRYSDFMPEDSPNIYAEEVVLLEIACQSCNERFQVEVNSGVIKAHGHGTLADAVGKKAISYGDPPRHGRKDTCLAGDSMNSVPQSVLQFWRKAPWQSGLRFYRVPELEIDVVPDWAKEDF